MVLYLEGNEVDNNPAMPYYELGEDFFTFAGSYSGP